MKYHVALFAVVFISAASAGPPPLGTLEAGSIRYDAAVEAVGTLASMESDARTQFGEPVGKLRVTASVMDVEMDWEQVAVELAGVGITPLQEGTAPTERFESGTLSTSSPGGRSYFFVGPLAGEPHPTVSFATEDAVASSQDAPVEQHRTFVRARPPIVVGVDGTVQFEASKPLRAVVAGSFIISVFDVEFAIDGETPSQFWTGERRESTAGVGVGENRRQQAYITVHDGTMTLDLVGAEPWTLHVRDAHIKSDGEARLIDAYGWLATPRGTVEASGQDIVLAGPVALDLPGSRNGYVSATIQESGLATLDGQTMQLGARDGSPWTLALAIMAVLGAAAAYGRRWWRVRALDRALERGEWTRAVEIASRLSKGPRDHQVRLGLATAFVRTGRADKALDTLGQPQEWPSSHRAGVAFTRAVAQAMQGREADALRDLDSALALDPSLDAEADRNHVLRTLVDRRGIAGYG